MNRVFTAAVVGLVASTPASAQLNPGRVYADPTKIEFCLKNAEKNFDDMVENCRRWTVEG